jgi:PAS domain S-box-containing protein/putative nucleotidyltransferase with HDIG domain
MKRPASYPVFRISIFYFIFGGLWIIISDRILEIVATDVHELTILQTYKGVIFVIISVLFLYFVVRHEFRKHEKTDIAFRESEEKYRLLMQNANDGIVIADIETGAMLEVNRKIEEFTGQSANQLIGKNLTLLYPENDYDRCQKLLGDALLNGYALTGDLRMLHRDGRNIPVEVSTSIVTIGRKKIIQCIFRDISRRLMAEEAHQKEKERAVQYLDIAGVIIVVLDPRGSVSLINRKGSDILGFPEEEIIGKNWFDNFVPLQARVDARVLYSRLVNRNADEDREEHFESPVLSRDGSERLISWNMLLIRDGSGGVISSLSSGEDITARKHAEEQARYRLEHLTTLHAIDMIISSSLDLRVTLQKILDLVISQLHVDAASILLLNPHTQQLEYAAMQGFRDTGIRHSQIRLGEGIAGRAALEHRIIGVPNLSDDDDFLRSSLIASEDFTSYYAVPLIAKGRVQGVLDILHRSSLVLDEEWRGFLEALAAQAAIAIDNATLFKELQRSNTELILAYDTTIEGWSRALELRDQETEGHTKRTTEMTLRLARAMGISEAELVHVRRGALLHDIGKMSIPDSILLKTGPLTEEEWQIMRRHPQYAFELLSPIAYLRPALDIPYCHHERWDGTGYPRGLKEEQIPLASRIFSLVDMWDALNTDRRYHIAWPEDRVKEYIRTLAGSQFDPKVVDLFLSSEFSPHENISV